MIKVRVHGRGGQGAVTFAHILCASATYEGKFGQSCQGVTIERRGAPVEAYGRIGGKPITERGVILDPDFVVVLNPMLVGVVNLEAGLSDAGRLVVNSARNLGFKHESTYIDANPIAMKILKTPITNTIMLGAFAAVTELISIDSIEKGARTILANFSKEKLNLNLEAIKTGYEEARNG